MYLHTLARVVNDALCCNLILLDLALQREGLKLASYSRLKASSLPFSFISSFLLDDRYFLDIYSTLSIIEYKVELSIASSTNNTLIGVLFRNNSEKRETKNFEIVRILSEREIVKFRASPSHACSRHALLERHSETATFTNGGSEAKSRTTNIITRVPGLSEFQTIVCRSFLRSFLHSCLQTSEKRLFIVTVLVLGETTSQHVNCF